MSKNDNAISVQIEELNRMVAWFESDEFVLEEAMDRYKKAETLASDIQKKLDVLRNDITVLKKKFDQ